MKTPVRFCDCPERCRRGSSPPKHDTNGHTGCRALSPESFSSMTTASKKRVRDLDRTKDVNKNLKRQKREQPEVKGVKANKENVATGDPKMNANNRPHVPTLTIAFVPVAPVAPFYYKHA